MHITRHPKKKKRKINHNHDLITTEMFYVSFIREEKRIHENFSKQFNHNKEDCHRVNFVDPNIKRNTLLKIYVLLRNLYIS